MKNKKKLLIASAITVVSVGVALTGVSAQEVLAVKSEKTIESQENKGNVKTEKVVKKQDKVLTKGENTAVVGEEAEVVEVETIEGAEVEVKKDKKVENKGQLNAQTHRSEVATFVKSLLDVADREAGIGQQVRVIAQQKAEIEEQVAQEVEAVEKRGSLKTFFLGTDYKNLGQLRKQNVQTRNQIAQLSRLIVKAETEEGRLALQTQIDALKLQQEGMDAFIVQNESKFSLFGWANKLISGYNKVETPEDTIVTLSEATVVPEAQPAE